MRSDREEYLVELLKRAAPQLLQLWGMLAEAHDDPEGELYLNYAIYEDMETCNQLLQEICEATGMTLEDVE